jgi:hypothetical protein
MFNEATKIFGGMNKPDAQLHRRPAPLLIIVAAATLTGHHAPEFPTSIPTPQSSSSVAMEVCGPTRLVHARGSLALLPHPCAHATLQPCNLACSVQVHLYMAAIRWLFHIQPKNDWAEGKFENGGRY